MAKFYFSPDSSIFSLARHTSSYFTRSGRPPLFIFLRCLPNTQVKITGLSAAILSGKGGVP